MKHTRLLATPLLLAALTANVFGGTFKTALRLPAGNSPSAVAVGDFNRDGNLDIVVANNGDASAQVFLGNGNGSFKPQPPIALDGAPVALAVGDFNGDGILDVVALTTDLFVLLGNGNGTFRIGGIVAAGNLPNCLVAADFNGDGKLDLVVGGGYYGGDVTVLLGKGSGTFRAPVTYNLEGAAIAIESGDFNGDGKLDLVVSELDRDSGQASLAVLPETGKGISEHPLRLWGMDPRLWLWLISTATVSWM